MTGKTERFTLKSAVYSFAAKIETRYELPYDLVIKRLWSLRTLHGTAHTARLLGVSTSTVCNWLAGTQGLSRITARWIVVAAQLHPTQLARLTAPSRGAKYVDRTKRKRVDKTPVADDYCI